MLLGDDDAVVKEMVTSTMAKKGFNQRNYKHIVTFLVIVFVSILHLNSQANTTATFASAAGLPRFDVSAVAANNTANGVEPFTCPFRDYEQSPNRMYGLTDPEYPLAFLRTSFYIYGKPPLLLPVSKPAATGGKVCSRHRQPGEVFLSMDGTNPSILSLERLEKEIAPEKFPARQLMAQYPSAMYLVSTTFKANHQCIYYSDNKLGDRTRFQPIEGRQEQEADFLLVDANIQTLLQTPIWEVDNHGGGDGGNITTHHHCNADDARLFVHDGDIWMSYKRYETMGKTLRINRLRFQYHPNNSKEKSSQIVAFADSREEIAICCGRNFGALSQAEQSSLGILSMLTWPDPVWIQSMSTRKILRNQTISATKVNFEDPNHIKSRMPNKKASEFHGTSGHLLYLAQWDEYLGIGHFHRERRWNKDPRRDAAFGHHYTHAFFTISATTPHRLTRLSQEFLFPSNVPNYTSDADIVQFASGLEWVPSSLSPTQHQQKHLAIGYGINDCEGTIVIVEWTMVESMLHPVAEGVQVAQLMRNISRAEFLEAILSQSSPA